MRSMSASASRAARGGPAPASHERASAARAPRRAAGYTSPMNSTGLRRSRARRRRDARRRRARARARARRCSPSKPSAITALSARLGDAFVAAVELILNCRGRVVVCGIGKSGHVGRKLAATLASTGTPAFFVHADRSDARRPRDDHAATTSCSCCPIPARPTSSCALTAARQARRARRSIALTGNEQSSLAQARRHPPRRARRHRGLSARPRADRQHDRRARAGRRARARAARRARLLGARTSCARIRAARSAGGSLTRVPT